MAQPKKKMTSTRSGNRRSQIRMQAVSLATCQKCKTAIKPHTVCYVCGTYGGTKVIEMDKKEKKQAKTTEEAEK